MQWLINLIGTYRTEQQGESKMTWWQNVLSEFNTTGKEEEEKPDPFILEIESKGYAYTDADGWWERTWTTESEPKESIREIYQQLEGGDWHKLMIGYGDEVFYEQKVEKKQSEVSD